MILNTLLGLSLVIIVSFDTQALPANPAPWMQMSVRQKDAVFMPLCRGRPNASCIGSDDPRYKAELRPDEINDLIVDSISACKRPVRAMIDAQ